MDWKQSFNPTILKEGYSLYIHQCCEPIQIRGNFYEGFIADPAKSSHYFVRAELEGNEITSIRCSCPTGQSGTLCLHEAAFLFNLEKQLSDSSLSKVAPKAPSFRSWLEKNASSSPIHEPKSPLKNSALSSQEVNELEQAIQALKGKGSSRSPHFNSSSFLENPLISKQEGNDFSIPKKKPRRFEPAFFKPRNSQRKFSFAPLFSRSRRFQCGNRRLNSFT